MSMDRRQFLVGSGASCAAASLGRPAAETAPTADLTTWEAVQGLFDTDPRYLHFAGMLLASHPRPVREAIERHRRALDADPAATVLEMGSDLEARVRQRGAAYLKTAPELIALTDSTTMGLGLLYTGLDLAPGDEVLYSAHEHYSTRCALALRAKRDGVAPRQITLFDDIVRVTPGGLVQRLMAQIGPKTRALAVTWVHSATGLKLPVADLAAALAAVNALRPSTERVLLCVDGVHGLGVEDIDLPAMGCDFFVAGCHKWLLGPRGTGVLWGKAEAWPRLAPCIPTFDHATFMAWLEGRETSPSPRAWQVSPGGFHSFEHRWALEVAFGLHLRLGKGRVAERIHALLAQTREGLAKMPHITLATPTDSRLTAGIVCFDVAGVPPVEVVRRLRAQGIIASVTPYVDMHARLAPSLLNSPDEVDKVLAALHGMG
jgi:isopenicillin-N epimerase